MEQILPPHNRDAELAVIGSLIIDPQCFYNVESVIEPGDFYIEQNRWIYESIGNLHKAHALVDPVSLCDELNRQGHLEDIRGAATITSFIGRTPTALNVMQYAKIVSRTSSLRSLINISCKMAEMAYRDDDQRVDEIFSRVRQMVNAASPMQSSDSVLLWWDSLELVFQQQLEIAKENELVEEGLRKPLPMLPWKSMHRFIKSIEGGTLALVAAESGVGKTTFLECCAEHWAKQGHHVVFFHLELRHKIMLQRRTIRQSGTPKSILDTGEITKEMSEAYQRIAKWPGAIHYIHCPGWTAGSICAKIHQMKSQGFCDIVIIDYLQKIKKLFQHGLTPAQVVGEQVEDIKNTGEQLDLSIWLASQFSNKSKGKAIKTAADTRDSGEPEQKCNLAITLNRQILIAPYKNNGHVVVEAGSRSPETIVRADKNTAGPTGQVKMYFDGPRYRISDLAQEKEPLNF